MLGNLLLVIDGSEASIAAANFAVRLAAQVDSILHAIYVVDTATMDYLMQMRIFIAEERQEFEKDLERTGTRYLDYVKTIGRKCHVEIQPHLKRGRFHQTVLQTSRELEVDAIILGGWCASVTRKDATCVERQLVLTDSKCPVIIVR